MRTLFNSRPNSPEALFTKYPLETGARGASRARNAACRCQARHGRLAIATCAQSRQPIPARSRQYRIHTRRITSNPRARASLLSSIAATIPDSPNSVAVESCPIADNPRMYTLDTLTQKIRGIVTNTRNYIWKEPQQKNQGSSRCRHKTLHARPAQTAQRSAMRQQPAQPQQNQSRLTQTNAPQNFPHLVARIFAQRLLRWIIQQIHQLAVIILLKFVQRPPQQKMQIQFAPQFPQRATRPAIQNRLRHAQSPAKSRNDPAYGSHLHLRRRISHQI